MVDLGFLLIALSIILILPNIPIYFWKNGWRNIEAVPPHVGIPTFLRKPLWNSKPIEPGSHFFWFFPWFQGFINVKVEEINDDSKIEVILRKDTAPVSFSYGYTVVPDAKNSEMLRMFIESGGEEGVKTQIKQEFDSRAREFLTSPDSGPQDFNEAQGIQPEMAAVLLRQLVPYAEMPQICFDKEHTLRVPWPTSTLLKYFSEPKGMPNTVEIKHYGKIDSKNQSSSIWEKLDEEMIKLKSESCEKYGELMLQVKQRRQEIQNVLSGSGNLPKTGLGVRLRRLAIGEVIPTDPEHKKSLARKAIELAERESENIEMKHAKEEIKGAAEDLKISSREAREFFQTQTGKVKKEISEKVFSVSEETGTIITAIAEAIARVLNSRGENEKKKGDS